MFGTGNWEWEKGIDFISLVWLCLRIQFWEMNYFPFFVFHSLSNAEKCRELSIYLFNNSLLQPQSVQPDIIWLSFPFTQFFQFSTFTISIYFTFLYWILCSTKQNNEFSFSRLIPFLCNSIICTKRTLSIMSKRIYNIYIYIYIHTHTQLYTYILYIFSNYTF